MKLVHCSNFSKGSASQNSKLSKKPSALRQFALGLVIATILALCKSQLVSSQSMWGAMNYGYGDGAALNNAYYSGMYANNYSPYYSSDSYYGMPATYSQASDNSYANSGAEYYRSLPSAGQASTGNSNGASYSAMSTANDAYYGPNLNTGNGMYTASYDPSYMGGGFPNYMNYPNYGVGGMNSMPGSGFTNPSPMSGMNYASGFPGMQNQNIVTPVSSSYNPAAAGSYLSQIPPTGNAYPNAGINNNVNKNSGYTYSTKISQDGIGSGSTNGGSNSQMPLIIGLSVGGGVALILGIGAAIYFTKNKKKASDEFINMETSTAYDYGNPRNNAYGSYR